VKTFDCVGCAIDYLEDLRVTTDTECDERNATINDDEPLSESLQDIIDSFDTQVCDEAEFRSIEFIVDGDCGDQIVLINNLTVLPDEEAPRFITQEDTCLKANGQWAQFRSSDAIFAVTDLRSKSYHFSHSMRCVRYTGWW